MTYDLDINGGPHHRGICPDCGHFNGDCTDGLCESCFECLPQMIDKPEFPEDIEPIELIDIVIEVCAKRLPQHQSGNVCTLCDSLSMKKPKSCIRNSNEKAGILADVGTVWSSDH